MVVELFRLRLGDLLIEPFSIEYDEPDWWWVSLGAFEIGDTNRSLIHIEAAGCTWQFQWLWSSDDCHIVERTVFRGKGRA